MTTNRLAKSEAPRVSLKGMTDREKLEWANSNQAEVNAERAKDKMAPIEWVLRDGHLAIQFKR